MTNRDFLNAVLTADVSDEVKEFATASITKMDERNSKRKAKVSKTAEANKPIKEAILKTVTDKPITAAELATIVGVSTAKASALATQLTKEGALVATDVKVKGKGKVKGYTLSVD